jgi:hypothetical protein
MVAGETYKIQAGEPACHWLYEDELPDPDIDDIALKKIVCSRKLVRAVSSPFVTFCAVGEHPNPRGTRKYGIVRFEFVSAAK